MSADGAEAQEAVVLGPDGEPMSKNAFKKAQKAKENEEKKAAKAKAVADQKEAAGPAKGKLGGDDEDVDPTKYFENRTNSLAAFEVSDMKKDTRCLPFPCIVF